MAVVRSGVTRGSRGDFSRGSYLRCWNMLGVEFESFLNPDLQFRGVWIWEKMSAYPSKPKAWLDSREYYSVGWVKQQLFSNPSLRTECHYCLSMKKCWITEGVSCLVVTTLIPHTFSSACLLSRYICNFQYIHVFLIHRHTRFPMPGSHQSLHDPMPISSAPGEEAELLQISNLPGEDAERATKLGGLPGCWCI